MADGGEDSAEMAKDTVTAHSVGSKVWIEDKDSDAAWVPGEVLTVDDAAGAVTVKLDGGKEVRSRAGRRGGGDDARTRARAWGEARDFRLGRGGGGDGRGGSVRGARR